MLYKNINNNKIQLNSLKIMATKNNKYNKTAQKINFVVLKNAKVTELDLLEAGIDYNDYHKYNIVVVDIKEDKKIKKSIFKKIKDWFKNITD